MTQHPQAVNAAPPPSAPPGDWEYALRIPPGALGPGIVRAHVRTVLLRHAVRPDLIDNAELIASELTTNSLANSGDSVAVRLAHTRYTPAESRIRLSVWDSSPRLALPPSLPCSLDSENGRGLWLLRACADEWGQYLLANGRRSTGGKEVWAEWRTA